MLRVDVRGLRQGAVPTEASVPPEDAVFHGLAVGLAGPVAVCGELQAAGAGTYRWTGTISGSVQGECRRCLVSVRMPFTVSAEAVYTTDPAALDDPGVYQLAEPVTVIDLGPAVREEVGLAAPQYPLCREDCAGLCPRCGADLNQGPCPCGRPTTTV